MAKLRAYHYTAQTKPDKAAYQHYGLDLEKAAVRDNVEAGVLEASLSKVKIIQVGWQCRGAEMVSACFGAGLSEVKTIQAG